MMGSMQALSIVIKKASAQNFVGSAVLNLLQSQVNFSTFSCLSSKSPFMLFIYLLKFKQAKVMAGNYSVRSLLEKMIESANSAYLGILERYAIQKTK